MFSFPLYLIARPNILVYYFALLLCILIFRRNVLDPQIFAAFLSPYSRTFVEFLEIGQTRFLTFHCFHDDINRRKVHWKKDPAR